MDCKTVQSMIIPYVQRQLDDKHLEEFIDHIGECQECHEELEIFFTIHFALQRLDEDKNISYNIQKMLEDDLAASERKVRVRKLVRVFNYGMMFVAELILAVVLFMQIEMWNSSSIEDTFVFRMMYGETVESELIVNTNMETIVTEKESGQDGKEDERKISVD